MVPSLKYLAAQAVQQATAAGHNYPVAPPEDLRVYLQTIQYVQEHTDDDLEATNTLAGTCTEWLTTYSALDEEISDEKAMEVVTEAANLRDQVTALIGRVKPTLDWLNSQAEEPMLRTSLALYQQMSGRLLFFGNQLQSVVDLLGDGTA